MAPNGAFLRPEVEQGSSQEGNQKPITSPFPTLLLGHIQVSFPDHPHSTQALAVPFEERAGDEQLSSTLPSQDRQIPWLLSQG